MKIHTVDKKEKLKKIKIMLYILVNSFIKNLFELQIKLHYTDKSALAASD